MRARSALPLLALGMLAGATLPAGSAEAAVNYSVTWGAFDDSFSFTAAAPITSQTVIKPTTCSSGGVSYSDCDVVLRPAGSAATVVDGVTFDANPVADAFGFVLNHSVSGYLEFATDAYSIDGDHSVGSATLSVSGAPVLATQTSYSFASPPFGDSFTWTTTAPVTSATIIRADTCMSGGAAAFNCNVLFDPAGSPPKMFNPYVTLPTESDDYLIVGYGSTEPYIPAGDTYYTDAYAAGAFTTDGTHKGVASTLTVAGLATSPAPEPATWAMFVLGFGAIGAGVRRRWHSLIMTSVQDRPNIAAEINVHGAPLRVDLRSRCRTLFRLSTG